MGEREPAPAATSAKKVRYPLSRLALAHLGLPVYLLSTCHPKYGHNLAAFAMVMLVSYKPPLYLLVAEPRNDSCRNLRKTREFVLNVVTPALIEAVAVVSEQYPPGVSEFSLVKLTPLKGVKVAPQRVRESPLHVEGRVVRARRLASGQFLFEAEVVALSGDPGFARLSFAEQKRALDPVYAFRPQGEPTVPTFGLGEKLKEI